MNGGTLSDEQRIDWLRLVRSENVGPRTFRALVNRFGGAGAALEALPDLVRGSGRPALRIASRAEALREIERARAMGARFVALGEPDYPKPLRAIDTAPPLVCIRGAVSALHRPCVAVVGSRNASAAGMTFAGRLAAALSAEGFTIVSGLARGIDTAAHRDAAPGATAAVLAGGHDRVYPPENEPLLTRIVEEGGAAVSEMPLGLVPRGREFPRRNRIVSGLCLGVIVVEAARRSGSLITARFALEQGREVFAVPGSPLDPRCEGTNDLIRSGATLCAEAEHVLAVLAPLIGTEPADTVDAREHGPASEADVLIDELDFLDEDGARAPATAPAAFAAWGDDVERDPTPANDMDLVLRILGPGPVGIDDLARQSGLPLRSVQSALVELEVAGRLERHGGNAVSLAIGRETA